MTPTTAPTPAPTAATRKPRESKSHIYIVRDSAARGDDGKPTPPRLVRAVNSSQALTHVVDATITVVRATQDECIELAAAGVKVETAAGGEGGAA